MGQLTRPLVSGVLLHAFKSVAEERQKKRRVTVTLTRELWGSSTSGDDTPLKQSSNRIPTARIIAPLCVCVGGPLKEAAGSVGDGWPGGVSRNRIMSWATQDTRVRVHSDSEARREASRRWPP